MNAYNMNTKSLSEIIKDRGRDPEDVFSEIAEENEKMKEMGISIKDGENVVKK